MQIRRESIIAIILTLDEQEASWLKAVVQNPIGVTPEEEDQFNKDMRKKFWNTLDITVYKDIEKHREKII